MSQTNVIAAVLAVAFFIFITTRGELPRYAAVLVGDGSGASGGSSSEPQGASIFSDPGQWLWEQSGIETLPGYLIWGR